MLYTGFEPAILGSEWPQNHATDSAANGSGFVYLTPDLIVSMNYLRNYSE